MTISGCFNLKVIGCSATNLENNIADGQFGYGIADASYGTIVENCVWDTTRHGYTTAQALTAVNTTDHNALAIPGAYGFIVKACKGIGGTSAPFDTHHGSENGTFANCMSDLTADAGFGIRGRRHRLISPIVRRSNGAGIVAFTDFSSGDTADDFWMSGNEQDDWTSLLVTDPDIECRGLPMEFRDGVYEVSGFVKIKTAGSVAIEHKGGSVLWTASMQMETTTLDGAWPLTDDTSRGVFHVFNSNLDMAGVVFSSSTIVVKKGADIVCVVGATSSTTPFGVFCQGGRANFVNRGRIRIALPADGVLFSNTGIIRSESDGDFSFSLIGADNANTHNLRGRDVNVSSSDGTVVWYAAQPGKGLSKIVDDYTITEIAGTGSEITDAYIPPLADLKVHLGGLGAGRIKMKFVFNKVGSNGVANMKWDSFGAFYDQLNTVAGTDAVVCQVDIIITSTTTYTTIFEWSGGSDSGEATDVNPLSRRRVLTDTEAGGIATTSGNLLDFDPTIATGDTLNLVSKEIWVSSGGNAQ